MSSLQKEKKGQWLEEKKCRGAAVVIFEFFLERERLLSSFPANSTVGSLQDKKESCSTRSRLRVDIGFEDF